MSRHLSPSELERFRRQALSADELLEAGDHLALCAECARQVAEPEARAPVTAWRWHDALDHPDEGELFAYVDGELEPSQTEGLRSHLDRCATCRGEVLSLEAFRRAESRQSARVYTPEPEPRPGAQPEAQPAPLSDWRRWLQLPALRWAASAGALAAVAVGVWLGTRPDASEVARLRAEVGRLASERSAERSELERLQAELNAVRQQGGTAARPPVAPPRGGKAPQPQAGQPQPAAPSGSPVPTPELPPAPRPVVPGPRIARETAEPPAMPQVIAALRPRNDTLMGEGEGRAFRVRMPLGTVVASPLPQFEWEPLADAEAYVVTVFDESFTEVLKSSPVGETRWTADRSLERGKTYRWEVAALRGSEEIGSAPRPPQATARFRVLDAGTAAKLARTAAAGRLDLARQYASAGLLDEAERELRTLAADESLAPDQKKAAQSLLAAVSRWRTGAVSPKQPPAR